jgi:DNA-binding SARP family transcriptional activator/tetratricopeptide (TPR) repeat protein
MDEVSGGGSGSAGGGTTSSSRFRLQLVGRFAVFRDGELLPDRDVGSRKGRTLLKVLLLHHGEPLSVDRLQEILWPDEPPANVARNVASLVSRLRALLGAGSIEGGSGTYRFRPQPHVEVDLLEAERFATEARSHLTAEEPALAAVAATRGLELVTGGTVLAGDPDSDWADPARAIQTRLRRQLRHAWWEAALALDDHATAASLAEDSLDEDPLDEEAGRALMRARHRAGESAEALRVYDRLRNELTEELGVDPSPATQELHLQVLRAEEPTVPPRQDAAPRARGWASTSADHRDGLVGRDGELDQLREWWLDAASGRTTAVLIAGEAGIGKTRLADELVVEAEVTGAMVLRVRCYEAERSHFLAPFAEIVATLAQRTAAERLRWVVDRWDRVLARLVPELDALLGPFDPEPAAPDVERRRTFQALSAVFRRLADDRPLLVFLDDLHNAGASSVEFLHFLLRHVGRARLLVVATSRVEEGGELHHELADVVERLDLGPLPDIAVTELVRGAGADRFGPEIIATTRGHTLAVVETLHALAEADDELDSLPVPGSLKVAVQQRLDRAGDEVEELLRGAATLGSTFDLTVAARLLELPLQEAARRSEQAMRARLLVEDGPRFAFTNDLIQQIVYDSTPRPLRVARHHRAASLLTGKPEAVAWHATAAEDWATAWPAWLAAADQAARRYANRDAEQLLGHAIGAAEAAGEAVGVARTLLARAMAREALADFRGELHDLEAARELARAVGRPDLEVAALRQLGGDVLVGLGRPTTDCLPYLEAGLDVARSARLGRREVELQGRIAVIWSNRTRFDRAAEAAETALGRARQLEDDTALALALDAVKNVSAYTGDLDRLEAVVPELERLLAGQQDLNLLQYLAWTIFEGAVAPLARADWDRALQRLEEAIEVSRRTGHPWRSMFLAHRSWLHRQRGALGTALAEARLATDPEVSAGHPWWSTFAASMLGWVLSDLGEDAEAVRILEAGTAAAERDGMEGYLVRCVSHLALGHWRTGDRAQAEHDLDRAEALLERVTAPAGGAFLHGAHAYAATARVHLARGDAGAARRLLAVVAEPAERVGWQEIVATDRVLRARAHLVEGDPDGTTLLLAEGLEVTESAGLRPLAWEMRTVLAHAASLAGDDRGQEHHRQAADDHLAALAASVSDPQRRQRLCRSARRRAAALPGEPSS